MVECLSPKCPEEYVPGDTGYACPECGTPYPPDEVASPPEDENGPDDIDKPEVPCPDPDCEGKVPGGKEYCLICGTERDEEVKSPSPPQATCPNGHSVSENANYCPECGEPVDIDTYPESEGQNVVTLPSVSLIVEGEKFNIIDDGEVVIEDNRFGADARIAAVNSGIDQDNALYIHREFLEFRVDNETAYVKNIGEENPATYNGQEFEKGEERAMSDGDVIGLANVTEAEVRIT